jgi:replicative DNA helicase
MTEVATAPSFAAYGKHFQERVLQSMLMDHVWAEQLLEVIRPEYFELKYLQYLAQAYFKYAVKYKAFPTFQLLVTIIRDDLKQGSDKLLADQIVDYLMRVRSNPDPGDLEFVKDKSLDFCRKQALKEAMEKSIDLMQDEKYETIVDVIKKAVTVGTTPSLGHDFLVDYEQRFLTETRHCVATGIVELDEKDILGGGLGAGELGIVVAATGVGKSHLLVDFGAAALMRGVNVVHYTLELSETQVAKRYDSRICEVDFNEIPNNKEHILKKYDSLKDSMGRLVVKHYSTGTASIYTLRAHLERASTRGFKPGMMIIDYADIMRSSRQFDSLRHELKLVYEELRGLSDELRIPIWSASQSNKEGSNSDIVDLTNMSEAYGKAMVADVVLSISRKPQEKAAGLGRFYMAKNRAGRDGIVWPVRINTAQSRFTVLGQANTLEDENRDNEVQIKNNIRKKLKELEDDPSLRIKGAAKDDDAT